MMGVRMQAPQVNGGRAAPPLQLCNGFAIVTCSCDGCASRVGQGGRPVPMDGTGLRVGVFIFAVVG